MGKGKISDQLLSEVYKNPKYSGKHVIIIGGKVHATKTGAASSALLEKLLRKHPREVPKITYVPREESLGPLGSIVARASMARTKALC
jgi:hypothetical protein